MNNKDKLSNFLWGLMILLVLLEVNFSLPFLFPLSTIFIVLLSLMKDKEVSTTSMLTIKEVILLPFMLGNPRILIKKTIIVRKLDILEKNAIISLDFHLAINYLEKFLADVESLLIW
jgi:hypothetical protein